MTNAHIVVNNTVTDIAIDAQCIITAVNKGWVTVEYADDSTAKRRPNQLAEYTEQPTGKRTQAATLKQYRVGYRVSVTGTGRKSQASPLSAVATEWEGNDHGRVAQWASLLLGVPEMTHYEKYMHLNNGQMRMNCGNLINARVKKGEITIEEMRAVMMEQITSTAELDAQFRPDRIAK
jgi:hypothetical protein